MTPSIRRLTFALLAMMLWAAAPRMSHAVVAGPYNDLRETLTPGTNAALRRSGGKGAKGYCVVDNVKAVVDNSSSGVDVRGFFYMSGSTPDFVGNLRVTTFYGLDPSPASAALALVGFDHLAPQAVFSNEVFEGASGTLYPADYAAVLTLDQLPAQFPDFDLSPFQGSPSSVFYVFAGTVPSGDMAVIPEPQALLIAGVGVCFLGARARARRRGVC